MNRESSRAGTMEKLQARDAQSAGELLERSAGILLHPSSLPSLGGIGDFGPEAYAFADFLAQAGLSIWQILPLSPPGSGNSPYSSVSAFAGNPLLISLELLADRGWISKDKIKHLARSGGRVDSGRVDFGWVKDAKLPLVRQAAENFLRRSIAERQSFEDFKRDAFWLEDFVLFSVMRQLHQCDTWNEWPRPLARREPDALRTFSEQHQHELEVERAIQFAFFEQWWTLRKYCAQRGIKIVGDTAIFVSYESADVWHNPDLFHLDPDLRPTVVAGVPPDAFSATGQRWGNPLYRWDVSRLQGHNWWVQRMLWALKSCDIVRLDHFRGFESYWEIPASEPTAEKGRWVPGPRDDLFNVLYDCLGHLPFIAEDLGLITPEVIALRNRLNMPGMRVMQFGFGGPDVHIYLPHRFEPNCVVYTGTHDNDTVVGWWNSSASPKEKEEAEIYIGEAKDGIHWAFIRAAFASVAQMAIVPLQDVLGLDGHARMNIPAHGDGNWGWRFERGALTPELAKKLSGLLRACDRVSASSDRRHAGQDAYQASAA